MTIKYAMQSWLEKKDEIWGEVVEKHFGEKEQEIISCVTAWAAVAARPRMDREPSIPIASPYRRSGRARPIDASEHAKGRRERSSDFDGATQ